MSSENDSRVHREKDGKGSRVSAGCHLPTRSVRDQSPGQPDPDLSGARPK